MEEEYIKLIFGLKLKQIRTERNLSLFGLSKLSGLSKSYLNEIENGKKYPKPDKIAILSEKLDVPYDQMVSLKLDKNAVEEVIAKVVTTTETDAAGKHTVDPDKMKKRLGFWDRFKDNLIDIFAEDEDKTFQQ